MLPHSDTLSWFRTDQSLLFLLHATCLPRKQQIPICIVFGVTRSVPEPTIGWLRKFTYKYNKYRSKVHRNINVHTLLLIFFTYLNKTLLYYSRLMNTCHNQQILSFTIHLIGNLEVILYRVKIETSSGFLMDICLRSEM